MRPWLIYTLARVGVFAVLFAVLYVVLDGDWLTSAAVAAVAAFCISYIALGPLRRRVADELAERHARPVPTADADADAEDDELPVEQPRPASERDRGSEAETVDERRDAREL